MITAAAAQRSCPWASVTATPIRTPQNSPSKDTGAELLPRGELSLPSPAYLPRSRVPDPFSVVFTD